MIATQLTLAKPNSQRTVIPRLPSQDAAIHLAKGEKGGLTEAVGSTLFRAALIGSGLYLAGYRGGELVKGAVYGATAVEVFVLGYTFYHVNKAKRG